MKLKIFGLVILLGTVATIFQRTVVAQDTTFPSYHPDYPVPADWTGPVFTLSQDYPTELPSPENRPWEAIDYTTEPLRYLNAVLAYALEGNVEAEWDVAQNQVRKWYHTPWLHVGCNGREYIHGLTRERTSRPGELHPNQSEPSDFFDNWAVGFYNPVGGYTIGRVWHTGPSPEPRRAEFAPGTVAVKLLFTTAPVAKVPYLDGTLEWDANIYPDIDRNPCNVAELERENLKVRLLQVDLAVRDARADAETGWVFGTFVYSAAAEGTTIWERLVPIGLMWGNDPTVTTEIHREDAFINPDLSQTILNPNLIVSTTLTATNQTFLQHVGLGGRLNGPVDNPISSCLSCHGRARAPALSMTPNAARASEYPEERFTEFFQNVPAGAKVVTDSSAVRLDYSLQLAAGIENFLDSNPSSTPLISAPISPELSTAQIIPGVVTPLGGTLTSTHPTDLDEVGAQQEV